MTPTGGPIVAEEQPDAHPRARVACIGNARDRARSEAIGCSRQSGRLGGWRQGASCRAEKGQSMRERRVWLVVIRSAGGAQ